MRDGGDIGVANQRQNGVIERGRRDLDLAGCRQTPIGRQDQGQDLQLLAPHESLIVQAEIAALLDQRAHLRIPIEELLIEPGYL